MWREGLPGPPERGGHLCEEDPLRATRPLEWRATRSLEPAVEVIKTIRAIEGCIPSLAGTSHAASCLDSMSRRSADDDPQSFAASAFFNLSCARIAGIVHAALLRRGHVPSRRVVIDFEVTLGEPFAFCS